MKTYKEFTQLDEKVAATAAAGAAAMYGLGKLGDALGWAADKGIDLAKSELGNFRGIMKRRADNKHAGSEASSGKSHKKVS